MRCAPLTLLAGVALLWSMTSSRPAYACWEVSDVVGYRRCASFGDGWDITHRAPRPPVWGLRRNPFTRRLYRPGRWLGPDGASAGSRRVGCLDVRVAWAVDAHVPRGAVVLVLTFGNACDSVAAVSFRKLRVEARFADGSRDILSLYDPASEIHDAVVDGRDEAHEAFEFETADRTRDAPASICVDLARITSEGTPASEVAPVCLQRASETVDEHEVIGREWGAPFGSAWDLPAFYFFAELGAFARPSGLGDDTLRGETSAGQKYSFSGSPYARVTSYGSDAHLGARIAGPIYGGLTWRVSGAELPARAPLAASRGLSVVTDRSFVNFGGGGFVGAMFPRVEGVRLRADVAVGVQGDLIGIRQPVGDCPARPRCPADAVAPILEPRLVIEAWLNPWWSLISSVADDLLRPSAPAVGLALAFHIRSYDGAP